MDLIVPQAIEEVIAAFDASTAPVDEYGVQQALVTARGSLTNLGDAENVGAWSEVLAFSLGDHGAGSGARKTFFSLVSYDPNDHSTVYSPEIRGAENEILVHWTRRAKTVRHPVLKARYADLAWDMSRAIASAKPDPDMARSAVDAYLESLAGTLRSDAHLRLQIAVRALDLAVMIRDAARTDAARATLLKLHIEALDAGHSLWWIAFDRLIDDKRAGLSDSERGQLIVGLEGVVARRSNVSDPAVFDPHQAESAAKRLIKHYNKRGKNSDAKRLHEVIGRTFEHFASLGNSMLASALLQDSVNAYRDAGLPDESKRVRIEMEKKIAASHDEAATFTFEQTVSREDMDTFLAGIVAPDLGGTFAHIAGAFLQSPKTLEKQIAEIQKQSPLMAAIGQTIIGDNNVVATVGSVADDPFGRLIRQSAQNMSLSDMWLFAALDKTIEVHGAMPGHFVGWVARSKLFDELTLLMEGVVAWYEQDFVKAIHVLVPQIEKGLRAIAAKRGKPVTKRHPVDAGVSVAIGMGDMLAKEGIRDDLGPEIALHVLTLYCDPRGFNLRNGMAHGLLAADELNASTAARVIHTLLVLGIWEGLAEARKTAALS